MKDKIISGNVLSREFYLDKTLNVAQNLLGCCLAVANSPDIIKNSINNGRIIIDTALIKSGIIVETEAYLGFSDSAAHSYRQKPGGRTNAMFGECGRAYVYLIYGLYHCLNAVTRPPGEPEGVLIRALSAHFTDNIKECSGPGKLCRAMDITRDDYAVDLTGESRIVIFRPDDYIKPEIGISARVGVENSGEGALFPYRFFDKNSKSVSYKRKSIV